MKTRRLKQEKFLAGLAGSAVVATACHVAGISRRTAYNWRAAGKAFAARWDEAIDIATDALEAEARRRAFGWDEPVFHNGRKVGVIRRYSDRMMEVLLKAHRPEKFGDRFDVKHSGRLTLEQLVEASRDDGVSKP